MKHKFIFLIALFFVTFSAHATKDELNGSTLIKKCQAAIDIVDKLPMDYNFSDASYCLGYVKGFGDMNSLYSVIKNKGSFCIPEKVTLIQKIRVVVKYLKDNPNKLHKDEAFLVYYALEEAFPCD